MRKTLVVLALFGCAHAMPKRPLPNYDGREHRTSTSEALLWIPRVAVSPLYFTAEYLIRRPIGLLVRTAEAENWPAHIMNLFTAEHGNFGLVPTAFYEAGFAPSIGAYVFWDHVIAQPNYMRFHVDLGARWFYINLTDRLELPKKFTLTTMGGFTRRTDYPFYGLGPRSLDANETRYASSTGEGVIAISKRMWHLSAARLSAGIRAVTFFDEGCCDVPTLQQGVDMGLFAMPPGFRTGYADVFERLELTFDSRRPRPYLQTGVRTTAYFDVNHDVQGAAGTWLRYGATAGAFWDVWRNRILGLVGDIEFSDAVGDGSFVPFTEMPVYGGWGPMRGLRAGRAVGPSAASLTAEYEWPVWVWLDGVAHVGVGNVFDGHLEDLTPGNLRLSTGFGLRTNTSQDSKLEILLGFGTEAFSEGAKFTSFRLFVGATRGF